MSAGAPPIGRPGLLVAGRFALEAPIGAGAVGEVWRALHTSLGTRVAVKLVSGSDAETITRVVLEARAAAAIDSTHVVRILDQGEEHGVAWIAMELLDGESLADRLERVGRLAPVDVVRILGEVARGVARAHQKGIVHRDLKPANIFLARVDGGEVAKVLDFGIAKIAGSQAVQTRQGVMVGTPAYMSREQVVGAATIDHHADLWALAIIAYECLEGTLPYLASTMGEVFAQIVTPGALSRRPVATPGLGAWLERATHLELGARFHSAPELVDALAGTLGVEPSGALVGAPRAAPGRVSPVLIGALVALGAVAVALLFALLIELRASRAGAASASAPPAAASAPPAASAEPVETAPPRDEPSAAASAPSASPSASASPSSRPKPRTGGDRWGI